MIRFIILSSIAENLPQYIPCHLKIGQNVVSLNQEIFQNLNLLLSPLTLETMLFWGCHNLDENISHTQLHVLHVSLTSTLFLHIMYSLNFKCMVCSAPTSETMRLLELLLAPFCLLWSKNQIELKKFSLENGRSFDSKNVVQKRLNKTVFNLLYLY